MKSLHQPQQLESLIATLDEQAKMKHDYIAPASQLFFLEGKLVTSFGDTSVTYDPKKIFHTQMAEKLKIPAGYYNRMLADGVKLLDQNVNHWLKNETDKKYLLRTFENAANSYNTARALLSNGYSIIDNHAILFEALDAIKGTGVKVEICAAELSDTRMYLKVVCPEVEVRGGELLKNYKLAKEVGDGVISGFTLQNSEVGDGAFTISPRGVVLACTNGLVNTKDQLRKVHLGAKMDELKFNENKDVMRANLKLIREQIKHAVSIFLSKEYLNKLVNVYTELGTPKIEAPVQSVIEVVAKEYGISQERKENILKYFIDGGDTRRMGLASAMTFECQEQENPDVKNDTEIASFDMLRNFKAIEAQAMKLKQSSN